MFYGDHVRTPTTKWGCRMDESSSLDVTRMFLLESSVPSHSWVEAISVAVHVINRLPLVKLKISPQFQLFGHPPSYTHLHSFGCVFFSPSAT